MENMLHLRQTDKQASKGSEWVSEWGKLGTQIMEAKEEMK